ncbi:MAG: hypothetical protein HQL79_05440 [Magnetococcales bacterium]|nr:hypothetical protein [Magnetococcales bacterium]
MTSPRRIQANQTNSSLSTDPRSQTGKAKSSMNAIRHGLLSRHLLMEGEQPEANHTLVEDLFWTLRPEGAMEQGLVERISPLAIGTSSGVVDDGFNLPRTREAVSALMVQIGFRRCRKSYPRSYPQPCLGFK